MRNRSLFLRCVITCSVAVCWRRVALGGVKAEGENEANEGASAAGLSLSPPPPALLLPTHPLQIGQERKPPQQAEQHQHERAVKSASVTEQFHSSCDAPASLAQQRVNYEDDVSCFSHDDNTQGTGPNLRWVYADTVQLCMKECRREPACTHFTYNKVHKKCHLKYGVPSFARYPADMTGPRTCDASCLVGCVTYDVAPIQTIQISDKAPIFCQVACRGVPECVVFVYEPGRCLLFGSGFSAHRVVSKKYTLAGPRHYCEDPSDLRLEELRDGHSIGSCLKSDNFGSRTQELQGGFHTPDTRGCQQRCASDSRCTHYTYNVVSKLCYIKGGKPTYYFYKDDVTGSKDCIPD